jgi:hypothetical protein
MQGGNGMLNILAIESWYVQKNERISVSWHGLPMRVSGEMNGPSFSLTVRQWMSGLKAEAF